MENNNGKHVHIWDENDYFRSARVKIESIFNQSQTEEPNRLWTLKAYSMTCRFSLCPEDGRLNHRMSNLFLPVLDYFMSCLHTRCPVKTANCYFRIISCIDITSVCGIHNCWPFMYHHVKRVQVFVMRPQSIHELGSKRNPSFQIQSVLRGRTDTRQWVSRLHVDFDRRCIFTGKLCVWNGVEWVQAALSPILCRPKGLWSVGGGDMESLDTISSSSCTLGFCTLK